MMTLPLSKAIGRALLQAGRLSRWSLTNKLHFPRYYPKRDSSSYTYRTHTCGELTEKDVGKTVTLCGWTKKKRSLSAQHVTFIPLYDHTGTTQLTCTAHEWRDILSSMKTETVIKATGMVQERPENDQNREMLTGAIEIKMEKMEILNDIPDDLPFLPSSKMLNITEELSLREKQLDLRSPKMQHNLRLRSQVAMAMREFLVHKHEFVEVETPTLFRRTSEGAREFIVPSRKPGKFYSLVQSPQQFKQLLMVGGIDRYFQFSRCYRDEDLRADRQPEFTQVDLEMSFVKPEGIMSLIEDLLSTTLAQTVPHLKFTAPPFPRMEYKTAIKKYNSDKPDTREDPSDNMKLNFLWVVDFPLFTLNKDTGQLESSHHPFTAPVLKDEHLLYTGNSMDLEKVRGQHYDLVVNGVELGGGSIRVHKADQQEHVLKNILKVPTDEFTHLLKGLKSGCPPHGGIALGFDRLMALLCQSSSLRDVIAFPKSFHGRDLLTGAPSDIDAKELAKYHIASLLKKF